MDYTALSQDNDFQKWFKYQPLDAQIVRYAKDKSFIIAAGQKILDVYNAFANTFLKFAKERVSYYGKNNLLSQKDFDDITKIKKIASVLENTNIWKSFDSDEEGINISIGNENKIDDLSDVSIVSTKLKVNDIKCGSVCVIGPTRMDYNQVIEALEFLSDKLEELEKDKKEES